METIHVETAEEMATAVRRESRSATIVVAAAAVADYRPATRQTQKSAKKKGATRLALEGTPDVVATAVARKAGRIVVGFAAETTDVEERARGKLDRKALDLIVANDVTAEGAGFDVDTNVVTLIDVDGRESLPLLAKDAVADAIFDRVAALRAKRRKAKPARKKRSRSS